MVLPVVLGAAASLMLATTASAFLPHWGNGEIKTPIPTEFEIVEIEEPFADGTVVVNCSRGLDFGRAGKIGSVAKAGFVFQNCTAPTLGNVPCTSKGAAAGEIKSKPLKGELGFINEKAEEVGLRLTAKIFAKFACGPAKAVLTGGLIAPITPINTLVTPEETLTLSYASTKGVQAVTQFEGGPTTQLELSVNKSTPTPIGIRMTDTIRPTMPLEVSTK